MIGMVEDFRDQEKIFFTNGLEEIFVLCGAPWKVPETSLGRTE
jgi:hypothetical protein